MVRVSVLIVCLGNNGHCTAWAMSEVLGRNDGTNSKNIKQGIESW